VSLEVYKEEPYFLASSQPEHKIYKISARTQWCAYSSWEKVGQVALQYATSSTLAAATQSQDPPREAL
jgi:hypothetical protein